MEKINIAELLKDCPRGMELYSPLCGKCVFDSLNMGTIICKKQNTQDIAFTSEGYYMLPVFEDCECMIFPSKDQRDWSKFHRPFKDGDILTSDKGNICIHKGPMYCDKNQQDFYCGYRIADRALVVKVLKEEFFGDINEFRLATEEERQKLFDAIKANGYKWNAETKTLMKLAKPRFRLGDKVVLVSEPEKQYIITGIDQRSDMVYYDATGVNTDSTLSMYSEWRLLPYGEDIREEYIKALATFGAEHQRMMCIEECAELIDALAKYDRGRAEAKDVITELADVSIMVEQMAVLYGKEEFKAEKKRKLKRLQKKIDEASNL